MYKNMIKPTLILTAICVVISLLVAVTEYITADAILKQQLTIAEESKKAVMTYAWEFKEIESDEYTAFTALNEDGKIIGYVITTSAKGYGGEIQVMTGIDIKGAVTGVEIISEQETEGLGKKAKKPDFINKFIGKDVERYNVVKIKAKEEGDIVAITGATITTTAVTDAVNEAKAVYEKITDN